MQRCPMLWLDLLAKFYPILCDEIFSEDNLKNENKPTNYKNLKN